MRTIAVLAAPILALAAPTVTYAAEVKPTASLACEAVDGKRRTKLPARNIRLDEPVECKLSVAGAARAEPFAARLVTTWIEYDGPKKKTPKKSDRHAGTVNGGAPWTVTLDSEKDFVACIDLVIEAMLTAPGEPKPAWSKKLTVKQFCPD